jgi:hypothetical protein
MKKREKVRRVESSSKGDTFLFPLDSQVYIWKLGKVGKGEGVELNWTLAWTDLSGRYYYWIGIVYYLRVIESGLFCGSGYSDSESRILRSSVLISADTSVQYTSQSNCGWVAFWKIQQYPVQQEERVKGNNSKYEDVETIEDQLVSVPGHVVLGEYNGFLTRFGRDRVLWDDVYVIPLSTSGRRSRQQ